MDTSVWRLNDELLSGTWNQKMRSLLSACDDSPSVIRWENVCLAMGEAVQVQNDFIIVDQVCFQAFRGFDWANEKKEYQWHIPDLCDRSMNVRPGCHIIGLGQALHKESQRTLVFEPGMQLLFRPEFSEDFGWDALHLFSGGFGGWSQALGWLPKTPLGLTVGREIFVDHDADVMAVWEQKYKIQAKALPIEKMKVWDATLKVGLLGDVKDPSIMHTLTTQVNLLCTASPPCVSWSRGGKQRALQCEEGWAFIDGIVCAFRAQACVLTLECADEFKKDPQAKLVLGLLDFLGYRRIWDQIVTYHHVADCFRTRWLSAWSRSDIAACPYDVCYTPKSGTKHAWNDDMYQFQMPATMIDQLSLSPSEVQFYADAHFLPKSKTSNPDMEPEAVIRARIADPKSPLPTLCASYGSQHLLDPTHLAKRGVFAVLVQENKAIRFVDPPRWIALLGAIEKIVLPVKMSLTFKLVGNAIAVPHALLALLIAFQSVHQKPLALSEILQKCWHSRLTQPSAILLAGLDFWTLMPFQEYLCAIQAHIPQTLGYGTHIRVRICFRRHRDQVDLLLPAEWSLRRLQLEVLKLDFHACGSVSCQGLNHQGDAHMTLQHMAILDFEWQLFLKSIEFATITFHGIEDRMPTAVKGSATKRTRPAKTVVLQVPNMDEVLELPTFQRFLGIMEEFYASTTIRTSNDAKQMIQIGVPNPGFVTRIPIKKGSQQEQLKNIANRLFPMETPRTVCIPPVPMTTTPYYPLYMLLPSEQKANTASVFLEEHRNKDNIHTADVPKVINSSDTIRFHGTIYTIQYHNAARPQPDTDIQVKNADIFTLTRAQQNKRTNTTTIKAAGHHHHDKPPTMFGPATFTERVEFTTNTNGWLASDEMDFALHILCTQHPEAGTRVKPTVWNSHTNEITHLDHTEFDLNPDNTYLIPMLVGAHWTGLVLKYQSQHATVHAIGLPIHAIPAIQDAMARLLDLRPHAVEFTHQNIAPIEHMCGWQVLCQWYFQANALQDRTNPLRAWHSVVPEHQQLIHEAIHDSIQEWSQARASQELIDFCRWLRTYHLTHTAQNIGISEPAVKCTLISTAEPPQQASSIPQSTLDFAIRHRLQFHSHHPAWMASDELDHALMQARSTHPHIYFAPPIIWTEQSNTTNAFNNLNVDCRTYSHAYFFVLRNQHWHLIELLRVSQQALIFSTLTYQATSLYEFIAAAAGLQHRAIQITHRPQITPDGMCGWVLLWQTFLRHQIPIPQTAPETILALDLSNYALPINQLRAHMARDMQHVQGMDQCKQMATAIRDTHLSNVITGRIPGQYGHGGAPGQAEDHADRENKTQKAQKAVIDPLFVNDPWAKRQNRPTQTKWEDLYLNDQHPFKTTNKQPIAQLHRLQHTPNRTGIILATKQHLPELSKIPSPGPLAVLLPGADKSALGDIAPHAQGPFEVVLEDRAMKTSYKRLVILFIIKGDVSYVLPEPTTKCTAADFTELVAELDSRLVPAPDFQQAKQDPTGTFRKLLTSIHNTLDENITMYGLRRNTTGVQNKDEHLQIICRVPTNTRTQLLEASGEHALLMRDFIDKQPDNPDTSILPRFTMPSISNLHDLRISTKGVPGAAGIILARRGLALRVWAKDIANARRMFLASDSRITKDNEHVVPRLTYESSGWPNTIEAASVIKTVLEATGAAPIPTRAYRVAGVFSWSLAFQTAPTKERFIVEVGGKSHEILLVPTLNRYNPKATAAQQATKAKRGKQNVPEPTHQPPTTVPLGNPAARQETQRLDRLEEKVIELETRQNRFERKFDERLDGVDSALRQLLQRSEPGRAREATGDTPPPKQSKLA